MRPRLTGRGIQLLLLGVAYVLCAAWLERLYLVSLGGAALSVLLVERVRAAGRAARLTSRDLRMSWWAALPEGRRSLETGRPFAVHVRLLTEGPGLGWATLGAYASSAIELREPARVALVPAAAETSLNLVAHASGNWWLHGALLTLEGGLGLFSTRAFFPSPLRLRVLPAVAPEHVSRRATEAVERVGQRRRWVHGAGSDLAEIREATPGDPYRHLAWKATARTRRLMVRQFQDETSMDHVLCLDLGMRAEPGGGQPLDRAIGALTARAHAALMGGDRVGLLMFDDRLRYRVDPGEGVRQMRRLMDRILDARSRPDQSTVTDAEAVAAAARYLYWLEGAVLRRQAPPLESARWGELHAGPSGELYDAPEMDRLVRSILAREAPVALRGAPGAMERIRLLLRVRGIETPRPVFPEDARLRGMVEALREAERTRCRIALWTDLDTSSLAVHPAVRRARQRHGMIVHAAA